MDHDRNVCVHKLQIFNCFNYFKQETSEEGALLVHFPNRKIYGDSTRNLLLQNYLHNLLFIRIMPGCLKANMCIRFCYVLLGLILYNIYKKVQAKTKISVFA